MTYLDYTELHLYHVKERSSLVHFSFSQRMPKEKKKINILNFQWPKKKKKEKKERQGYRNIQKEISSSSDGENTSS